MVEYRLRELEALRDLVAEVMAEDQPRDYGRIDALYQEIAYRTPSFDWNNWHKGLQGLQNADSSASRPREVFDPSVTSDSFQEFNQEELGQLLLMIHRMNRFCDYYFEDQIDNGVILKILDALISLHDN